MKKRTSLLWRMLVAVAIIFSLASVVSIQATISAPATVSAAPPVCPRTPASPLPANLSTGVSRNTNLDWANSSNASYYDVYFDTNPSPTTLVGSPTSSDWTLGYTLSYNTTYYWQVMAWNSSSGCSNTSPIWRFTTTDIVGAVTGWTWQFYGTGVTQWDNSGQPYDTNTRDSVMVVFNESLDPSTISASNFRVTYTYSQNGRIYTAVNETPKSAEYHYWTEYTDCENPSMGQQYFGLVFLTISRPMATNATPTVLQLLNGRTVVDSAVANDGIAPIITLSVQGSPSQGGVVNVTATSTEPLAHAKIVTMGMGEMPTTNFFPAQVNQTNEYGGYCDNFSERVGGYTYLDDMTVNGNVATYPFTTTVAVDPQESFFVEVYAHDQNTWCGCDDGGEWWLQDMWSSTSQFLNGKDSVVIHLWEGWNLISFPRTPVDPSIAQVFKNVAVDKVYTYQNGRWYGALLDPNSGTWNAPSNLGLLTNVQAGLGYWVYCEAQGQQPDYLDYISYLAEYYGTCDYTSIDVSWTDLLVELQPVNLLATPPSYSLTPGWNLVGVPVQGPIDLFQLKYDDGYSNIQHMPMTLVSDFLTSLKGHWTNLYWYLPPVTVWSSCYGPGFATSITWQGGYLGATPNTAQSPVWKLGFWMSAFNSLGIPYIPNTVPSWITGSNESFTCSFNGSFSGGPGGGNFGGDFEGYTSTDSYLEGNFNGIYSNDGTINGTFEGYIERDGYGEEDFGGTFHGWWSYDDGGNIILGGTCTGTTGLGRTITASFGAQEATWMSRYHGELNGNITSNGLFSSVDINSALMQQQAPVVLPGYGYWVYLDQAGTLVPPQ